MVAVRLLLSVVVFAIMGTLGWAAQGSYDTLWLLLFFGLAGLLTVQSSTLMTMLYATRTVGRLAILNVVTKVLWGVMAFVAVFVNAPLPTLALVFLLTEIVRAVVLWRLVKTHLDIEVAVHWRKTRTSSWPARRTSQHGRYHRLRQDRRQRIAFIASDTEIGWYGAAGLHSLSMLMALINWVLLRSSRARARAPRRSSRCRAAAWRIAGRRPGVLAMGPGPSWIATMYGEAFRPAVGTLRVLAPMFVLTYIAILCADCLIVLNRGWTLTTISVASLVVNGALNVAIVPRVAPGLGEGGVGVAAACVSTGVEAVVAVTMLYVIGRRSLDARNVSSTLKAPAVALVVILVDRSLPFGVIPRLAWTSCSTPCWWWPSARCACATSSASSRRPARAAPGRADGGLEPPAADQPAA